jgi:hypothetical protein
MSKPTTTMISDILMDLFMFTGSPQIVAVINRRRVSIALFEQIEGQPCFRFLR